MPSIPAAHVMAVAFTSGSTGTSQPHPKRWGELVASARLAERRFQFAAAGQPTVIATVPPQHMYGLETTIMLPLATGLTVHASQPFFPQDIGAALASVPPPRVLVTTPAHLRVCVKAELPLAAAVPHHLGDGAAVAGAGGRLRGGVRDGGDGNLRTDRSGIDRQPADGDGRAVDDV